MRYTLSWCYCDWETVSERLILYSLNQNISSGLSGIIFLSNLLTQELKLLISTHLLVKVNCCCTSFVGIIYRMGSTPITQPSRGSSTSETQMISKSCLWKNKNSQTHWKGSGRGRERESILDRWLDRKDIGSSFNKNSTASGDWLCSTDWACALNKISRDEVWGCKHKRFPDCHKWGKKDTKPENSRN